MIRNAITNARVKDSPNGPKAWMVLHPANDAILAYCDTQAEAERFVLDLAAIDTGVREEASTKGSI